MSATFLARIVHGASIAILVLASGAAIASSLAGGGGPPPDPFLGALTIAVVGGYTTLGRTIVTRTGNVIGWVFLGMGAAAAIGLPAEAYLQASYREPYVATLPLTDVAGWLASLAPASLALAIPMLFLLFPTGAPPTPRWRWIVRLWLIGSSLAFVWLAFRPGSVYSEAGRFDVVNPVGVSILDDVGWFFLNVGTASVLFAAVASVASLIVRFRSARGDERQQIKWLMLVGLAAATILALMFVLEATLPDPAPGEDGPDDLLWPVLVLVLVLGPPLATAVAVFRYRLYDIDLVIKKAVVFAILVPLLTATFVVAAATVGALVGRSTGSDVAVAFIVGASVVPMWRLSRGIADRVVYGGRATPYEVLTEFSGRLAETYSTDDVLPRMASVLASGTGADHVTIWVRVGDELRPVASWPGGTTGTPEGAAWVEVRHQGEPLGAITASMPVNDPLTPSKERLIADLAAQAGLVLRNVRLIEELRASRRRIVSAQDARARKLERDIHDGAQQQLVALAVKLGLAGSVLDRDPARARDLIAQLRSDANDALQNLRDLARGVYPPLLADKGLGAALRGQASKAPLPVEVHADGVGRYGEEVEAAVYFCALEALNNAAKHGAASRVDIRLAANDRALHFEVRDDGRGFDPHAGAPGTGLQGMLDRLEAIGGGLTVESSAGGGTVVRGEVPLSSAR